MTHAREVERYFNDGHFVPARLADDILADTVERYLVTPITVRGGDITWVYNPELGIFRPDGVAYIEGRVREILGERCKRGYIAEVVKLIQIGSYTARADFEEDPGVLVLENGVFHLDTGELTQHNAIHNAKARLPVKFNPRAECPRILKFLEEVIPGAVKVFQEWLGYHLIMDYRFAKALMLVGDGENGKSVLLNLMKAFFGPENVSEVDLYRLVANRFAAAELYTRLANLAPDVGSDELRRTGVFKALTGNDTIFAEKKHQHPFSFRNYAKLSFSTNKLPLTPDMSRAFFRRWLIINCPNIFTGDNCDPTIIDKLTTPEELSGLLNWALEGRQRLIQNGRFTKNQTAEEIQELYEEMSDPVTAFIRSCVELDPEGVVTKDDLYNAYHGFCRMKGYSPVLKNILTNELKPRILGLGEGKRKIDGKRSYVWTGISLKCLGCPGCLGSSYLSSTEAHIKQNKFTLDTLDTLDTCVDCGQPVTDGTTILWKGQDRVCGRCAQIRKKIREVG